MSRSGSSRSTSCTTSTVSASTVRIHVGSSSKVGSVHTWTISTDVLRSMNLDPAQARMGCTFVALVLAKTVYRNGCQLLSANDLNKSPTLPLANAMLFIVALGIDEGCRGHKAVKQRELDDGSKTNLFTIPDAITVVGGIHEVDFLIAKNAYANLAKSLRSVIKSDLLASFSQIYIIMVIQKKAILVVYDRKEESITLIDGHSGRAAMIIASPIDQLEFFCCNVLIKLFPTLTTDDVSLTILYKLAIQTFEISVIQMTSDGPAAQTLDKGKIFRRDANAPACSRA